MAVCKKLLREIKLDTTNTCGATLLTGVLRNLKEIEKTTIHHLVVGDLLGNNANCIIRHILLLLKKLAGKKSISTEIKKMGTMLSGIKFHLECNK
jgi:hypothetical protein